MKKVLLLILCLLFSNAWGETITVTGEELVIKEKKPVKEEPIVSKEEVSPSMVEKSSVSLFTDLSETLKTLPGVVTPGAFSGALYIRGTYPMETIFLLDNVFIYWPYRWGGMLLMFNTDLIKKVDFYAGGYPAKGNQALGGIIDVYYKEGSKKKRKGQLELSPTTMAFQMDGPIKKDKLSYYLSANRTHYDLLVKWFGGEKGRALPNFNDQYFKLYYEPTYKDKLSFGIVRTGEGMDMKMEEGYGSPDDEGGHFFYKYTKNIFAFNHKRVFSPSLSNELTLSYLIDKGRFRFYSPDYLFSGDLDYKDTALRNDFVIKKEGHEINVGGMVYRNKGKADDTYSFPIIEEVNGTWTEVKHKEEFHYQGTSDYYGLYLWDRYSGFGPIIDYGIRYENNNFTKEGVFSPRFSICFPIGGGKIKQSIGEYSQYPMDSYYLDEKEGNPKLKSQCSRQYILGYERDIGDDKRVKIEAYYSDLSKLILPDKAKNYLNKGKGYSRGIELFFQKKEEKRWDGWFSYAYSQAKREEAPGKYGTYSVVKEEVFYPTDQDRPHVASLVLNYNLTKKWKLSMKTTYYSGNPYTPLIGAIKGSDTYKAIWGEYKSKRLPSYFQTDLTITKKQKWGEWYIHFINLTGHKNIYDYYYSDDYSEKKAFEQLPFMFLGGCKVNF
ncbi:MAG: TonB-dependent receptor plug domain-containing protein [bacterium]